MSDSLLSVIPKSHPPQTVSSLGTFVLAMMLSPEIQRKAQKQLDDVIGQDRLPNFDDEPTLPFITAVVKEVIRYGILASGSLRCASIVLIDSSQLASCNPSW